MTGGFNGSGVFILPYNWENDAASGIDIRADRMDGQDGAIATGLSTCITKDGQQTLTANIPFANFKITSLGNATQPTDSINALQVRNSVTMWLGTSSGTNTVTASSATFPVLSYVAGQTFRFSLGGTCTGAVTLNIDSNGAKSVLKNGQPLVAGDWTSGDIAEVIYDGTNFNIASPTRTPFIPTGSLQPNTITTTQTSLASATTTDLGTIPSQNVLITGTTTITSFGSSAAVSSPIYYLKFNGALILTYNATSLIIEGSANITTAAGDTAVAEYLGSGNWKIRDYTPMSGLPVVAQTTAVTASPGDNSTNIATTAFVTAAIAAAAFPTTAGGVNTYVLASKAATGIVQQFGDSLAGSGLKPASVNGNTGTITSLSGTWQCMGFAAASTSTTGETLWLRIS